MYLPQAASLPLLLGIERDLFRCSHLVEEVELEPAVVNCSFAVTTSLPCDTSVIEAGTQGHDRTFPA